MNGNTCAIKAPKECSMIFAATDLLSQIFRRLYQKGVATQLAMPSSVLLGMALVVEVSETGFYTPPPLEGKIATDTFTPSPAPVVYKVSGPMGGGFLYTTGAEAENSAVQFSKESVPPLYKNRSSKVANNLAESRNCW